MEVSLNEKVDRLYRHEALGCAHEGAQGVPVRALGLAHKRRTEADLAAAFPDLDAAQHWQTRALRAEQEAERLRGSLLNERIERLKTPQPEGPTSEYKGAPYSSAGAVLKALIKDEGEQLAKRVERLERAVAEMAPFVPVKRLDPRNLPVEFAIGEIAREVEKR